jgi:hypothetical protein
MFVLETLSKRGEIWLKKTETEKETQLVDGGLGWV